MKELHCPACGTPCVRVISGTSLIEKTLNRLSIFQVRCQLCTTRFQARRPGNRVTSQEFDRREYRRLPVNFAATLILDQPAAGGFVTDISMGGCALQAETTLSRGTFVKFVLHAPAGQPDIKVDSAMICSVHPRSVGVKFLEFDPQDKQRMGQLMLELLAHEQAVSRSSSRS
ncbi:MAG: PilZ domain-containing protein [Nitrospira sp.]|nr:PilZ domain-containing protein [Nitrospira sp.]